MRGAGHVRRGALDEGRETLADPLAGWSAAYADGPHVPVGLDEPARAEPQIKRVALHLALELGQRFRPDLGKLVIERGRFRGRSIRGLR